MSNFIKQSFASLIGSLLGLFIFFGIGTTGLFLLLIAATTSKDAGPEVKNKSVLVFDLSTTISDAEPTSAGLVQRAFSGEDDNKMSLRSVLNAVEKAQKDKRIVGIYLDGTRTSTGGAGFATMKEIRQALEKFRASGKRIIAYAKDWSEQQYYLSSVADTVVLNPLGGMEVNGLSSQPLFLTGALQKFGIGVQVVRVGKFKGGVEPYVLNKLSPENRQQTQRLLDDVWQEWRNSVSVSRKMTPQQLQAIADNQALLEAQEAKSSKLVDKVAYLDEVISDLKKLTGADQDNKTFKQISLIEYAQVPGKQFGVERNSKNKIAVVYAEGDIVDGVGDDGEIGGDRFAKIFRRIRQDKNVKAVVLRINSPGGSATASEVMQREIRLTRQSKPVVVSMGDIAASGGYWIASDSNRIFAEPNTITGSIGVFGLLFNAQKLGNNNGITWDSVKTARYADTQTVSRPKSPEELALYQRSVNRIYNLFLYKVAKGRNLPQQKVGEIAQGRVWSGVAAKEIGLVDEIGGLDKAIAYTAREAKLGNDWELQDYPRLNTFEERFFGKMADEARAALKSKVSKSPDLLTAEFQKLQQELEVIQKMNDPRGIYARLPFNLKIE
jgi:protease-4